MFLTGDLLISDMQSLQTEKCHTKAMYAPGINGGVLLKFSTFFFSQKMRYAVITS